MGFQEKRQLDKGVEVMEGKTWVIAGISLRAPLKPIYTTTANTSLSSSGLVPMESSSSSGEEEEECSTTPTGEEARIPARFTCPSAPRKRKTAMKYHYGSGGVRREFFNPPDLESVFMRKIERAN